MFSGAPKVGTTTAMFLTFIHPAFLQLFAPHSALSDVVPSVQAVKVTSFLGFAIADIFIRRLVLLAVRFFSFSDVLLLLLEIITYALLAIAYVVTIRKVEE